MHTPRSFSTTALVRILGTLLLATTAAGCDEAAESGIIVDEPRLLDVGDDLDDDFDEDFDPIAHVYVSETRSSNARRKPVDVEWQLIMRTTHPSSFSALAPILAASLFGAACDDEPQQGIIVDEPEPRLLAVTDELAIYAVELDGETRRVEVPTSIDALPFRILEGDRVALEVLDANDGPMYRGPDEPTWSLAASCDPLTEAVAQFVLDGGLTEADEFRAIPWCPTIIGCED